MKTWGGRFEQPPDRLASEFGRADDLDRELVVDDIVGSMAHVRGLGKAGILSGEEVDLLLEGLAALRSDAEDGVLPWQPALEDVHMNVEAALEAKVGPLAGKLHTGRSRNDQVSTDLRLWLRRKLDDLDERLLVMERVVVVLASAHADVPMPGHTHVQPAQPVLFAHHLLAYVEMLERDRGRLADVRRRANVSPLGAGALAGAGFAIDRRALADELGFTDVARNSIDASGDRDFCIEALAAFGLAMVHLSRLAEEIAWWSSPRFGFIRVSDSFSTGSSMMPNKRNPDPAELVRGRAAVVIGQLAGAMALLKGLPLGYQRDLQELKRPLMEGARTLTTSLEVMAPLVEALEIDAPRMRAAAGDGHSTATAVADMLVERGVAFRAAHHIVGALVRRAEAAGVALRELDDRALAEALRSSPDPAARVLADDPDAPSSLRASTSVEAALARCDVIGGTAPARVRAELEAAASRLRLSPADRSDRAGASSPDSTAARPPS